MPLVVLAGCQHVFGVEPSGQPGDAASDDADTADAPPGDAGWSAPLEELVTLANGDDDVTMTGDRLVLFLNHTEAMTTFVSTTRRGSLAEAFPLATQVTELGVASTPRVSADGRTMLFAADDVTSSGEIYVATRGTLEDPWTINRRIAEVSSPLAEQGATFDGSGRQLVFASTRPGTGGTDLWTASRSSTVANFGTPRELTELNSIATDNGACLSADGLTLYFHSDVGGNLDIYVAHRSTPEASFDAAQPVPEINTAAIEHDPWLSPDEQYLYFVRMDPTTTAAKLMYVTRQ